MSTISGEPIWIELFTPDPQGAKKFYGALFGWTAEQGGEEYGGYITFRREGGQIAGCMDNQGGSMGPAVWSVYLQTDDVERTAAAAAEAGGQVVAGPMQVGEMGHMLFVDHPAAGAVGAWQGMAHTGFAVRDQPGAPAWFELLTRDLPGAIAFYEAVFGWETHVVSDTDEFRYTTLGGVEDTGSAGVMDANAFLPEGVPAHWMVYFETTDTDASVARVVELGGSVLQPAEDTPYGRLATVADPAGVAFRIMARPQD